MKFWKKFLLVMVPLSIVVALPLVLRNDSDVIPQAGGLRLEIITPHNETIQREFGEAFVKWYFEERGKKSTSIGVIPEAPARLSEC